MSVEAVTFKIAEESSIGILHTPSKSNRVGVLILVGGPQYRIGSHRQYVLLARALTNAGCSVFRFDPRGRGDAEGKFPGFDNLGTDIEAALQCFCAQKPDLEHIILWGLCDAASANLIHGYKFSSVKGMILCNPWVRSETGKARAIVKHYYGSQILSKSFWRRLIRGNVFILKSFTSFIQNMRLSLGMGSKAAHQKKASQADDFVIKMLNGMQRFSGNVLVLLSGEDLIAHEFKNLVKQDKSWRELMTKEQVLVQEIAGADHVLSRMLWREEMIETSLRWIESCTQRDA